MADDQLRLLSQKRAPKLATIKPNVVETDDERYTLVLNAPGREEIRISQPSTNVPLTSLRYISLHLLQVNCDIVLCIRIIISAAFNILYEILLK